jgi:tripartite-type tricarboxylate transporter receptor subunit TctC
LRIEKESRMSLMKLEAAAVAVAVLGGAAIAHAAEQSMPAYPIKPIHVIVHSPPGGAPDVVARILSERLAPALGQPVVVENRWGGSGTVALAAVARAEPDGYTLGTMSPPQAVAPSLVPQLPYDTARDLAPIRQTTRASMILVVRAGLPLGSVSELIAAAKAQPGRLTYASAGNGTPQHLVAEVFRRDAGVDIRHVPYKGAGAAVAALLGEQVDLLFTTAVTVGAHIHAGRLRPLASTGPSRISGFPDVPTLAESGFAGFDVRDWEGLVAPAHTPQSVIDRIAAEVSKALSAPEVVERLARVGLDPVADSDPAAFGVLIRSELERWAKVVREAGIRVD